MKPIGKQHPKNKQINAIIFNLGATGIGFICGVAIIFAGTTDEANANAFSSRFSYKYKYNSSFN